MLLADEVLADHVQRYIPGESFSTASRRNVRQMSRRGSSLFYIFND